MPRLRLASYDNLDFRIIRELCSPGSLEWTKRETYANIGKKLGVDEEIVRRRLIRHFETELVKGWQLVLNPHVLGLEAAQISVDVEENDKPNIIGRLKALEMAVFIFDYFGRGLWVVFYYEDERDLAEKTRLISSICGVSDYLVLRRAHYPFNASLERTDWRILKALRTNPRMNLSVMARRLGISARTAKRRLSAMMKHYAFYILPIIDIKSFMGLNYCFVVSAPNNEKKGVLDRMLFTKLSRITYANTGFDGHSIFAVLCQSISEAEGYLDWIRGLDGAIEVTMRVMKEMIPTHGWFDREIEIRARRSVHSPQDGPSR